MSDLVLLEASLFQFRTAMAAVQDDMFASQLRLTSDVLSNAVDAARETLNAARVHDIEFALNDLAAVVDELSNDDAGVLGPMIEMLRGDVALLRQETALPPALLDAIRAFRSKLHARQSAIERQTYREGGGDAALPHPPEDLEAEAVVLQARIAEAGFATPALDSFVDDPQSLRFHTIAEIIDELDLVAGSR